jgi:hypothetical protein
VRRALVLWLVLAGAYAATLGLRAEPGHERSLAEAHRLLTIASLADDGDVDLTDQYRERTWRSFSDRPLHPAVPASHGRIVEPQGLGYVVLAAPAYALGGATAVELQGAALLALAFVLGAALARRVVPEPWATRAALLTGLSPPALVASTVVAPEASAAALLAGAALLALRVRERPLSRWSTGCALLLALAPWLAVRLFLPAAVVALALARWLRRRQRGLSGFVALEIVLFSAVLFITVNDRLYGTLLPSDGDLLGGHRPARAGDVPARIPRLLGVLVDQDAGLLRWAPVLALAFAGAWLLWRSIRDRLAVALAEQIHVEVVATLLGLVGAAGLAAAALARPVLHGPWLVVPDLVAVLPCTVALVAWGLRHARRTGAVLGALTLAGAVWLLLAARLDPDAGVLPATGALPWGGVQDVLPRFGDSGPGEVAALALAVVVVVALAAGGVLRVRRLREGGSRGL